MGLVEAGVGLIPGGGGCKEMLLRSVEAGAAVRVIRGCAGDELSIFETLKKNFETIAMAKVSTSGSGCGVARISAAGR